MAATQLALIKLEVADLERSIGFFRLLGFATERDIAEHDGAAELYGIRATKLRLQIMKLAGTPPLRVELLEWRDRGPESAPTLRADGLGLMVKGLDAMLASLVSIGVGPVGSIRTSVSGSRRTRLVNVRDPDGHVVQLLEVSSSPE